MIVGESVVVHTPTEGGTDPGGAPIPGEPTLATIENVLVSPGPRDDLRDSTRPDGKKIAWTLHFPKTFSASLEGCSISVRGLPPRPVVGNPQPYMLANTPTPWWMPVELEDVDG